MPIDALLGFMDTIPISSYKENAGEQIIVEIVNRLKLLLEVRLNYITLNRRCDSISGGEIIAGESYENIVNDPNSLTGKYISEKKNLEVPCKRRKRVITNLISALIINLVDVMCVVQIERI